MSKLRLIVWLGAGVVITLSALFLRFVPIMIDRSQNQIIPHAPYEISQQASALHKTLVVGDLHADALLWKRNLTTENKANRGHVDFPKLRKGNIAIEVFPAVTKVPSGQNYTENSGDSDMIKWLAMAQLWPHRTWSSLAERALCQARRLHRYEEQYPGDIKVIKTSADLGKVLDARAGGATTLAALLSFEGAHALEGDIDNIDRFYKAGFRLMELHHFFDNELGGSLHGQSKSGLSPLGKDMVLKMEEAGIIIDVAHSSQAVVVDVLDLVTSPLIVSHTGFKGQCNSPRNISDALLKAIADKGGLIGIGFWEGAICDPSPEGIVAAIRYAIDIAGINHIALGSDWDGSTSVSVDASEVAILTQTMLDKGFSEDEIKKVMGQNLADFLMRELPQANPDQLMADKAS